MKIDWFKKLEAVTGKCAALKLRIPRHRTAQRPFGASHRQPAASHLLYIVFTAVLCIQRIHYCEHVFEY